MPSLVFLGFIVLFFFNDTPSTEIHTSVPPLSLPGALPIYSAGLARHAVERVEHHAWRGLGNARGNVPVHIDAGDTVSAAFERIGHALAAHQRNLDRKSTRLNSSH